MFFKEAKQLLNLGGSQSSDFDAQIADTTITMLTYILLAFRQRYDQYESMGALFRAMQGEVLRKTLDVRLLEMFLEMLNTICQALEKDIDELITLIINHPLTAQMVARMLPPELQQAS